MKVTPRNPTKAPGPRRPRVKPRETTEAFEQRIHEELTGVAAGDVTIDYTADWKNEAQIRALPPPEWLVEGWIPAKGYAVIYGEPGVGKTLQLAAWAKHVQRGERWRGLAVRQGPVLFFEAETFEGFGPRFDAFEAAFPRAGETAEAEIRYVERPTDLNHWHAVIAIIQAGRELARVAGEPLAMVVIEPLIESMSGDENSDGMEQASRALRIISRELGCVVVVGHHTNGDGEQERGNKKLRARAHTMIRMEAIDATTAALVVQKQRNHQPSVMQLAKDVIPIATADEPDRTSVVLTPLVEMTVLEYESQKRPSQDAKKKGRKKHDDEAKGDRARDLILAALPNEESDAISKRRVAAKTTGNGIGSELLKDVIEDMAGAGEIRSREGRQPGAFLYWKES